MERNKVRTSEETTSRRGLLFKAAGLIAAGVAARCGGVTQEDFDGDGIRNEIDKCPRRPAGSNGAPGVEQPDPNMPENTQVVEFDGDGDGIPDGCDLCPTTRDGDQFTDRDNDTRPAACDDDDTDPLR